VGIDADMRVGQPAQFDHAIVEALWRGMINRVGDLGRTASETFAFIVIFGLVDAGLKIEPLGVERS
jgi:hypothetical protein